ncbi:MAG: TaqI-like C-terminal specificity domain-containing protein [Bacteroidia bacterium]|nr:TaqI-like C-terminal specificity domain-containing protein [Bacteroidia bacterium]
MKSRENYSNSEFTKDGIIIAITKPEDFSKQKIIYREISEEMNAVLDSSGYFVNNKCYFVVGSKLSFLTLLFNSKLFTTSFLNYANITGGKGFDFLTKINVPPIIDINEQECFLLLERIENDPNNSKLVREINLLINSYYKLNEEETNFIESQ